jgi:NosR/NirI family transcriptional regulator, nitrous oxide reductase regulator
VTKQTLFIILTLLIALSVNIYGRKNLNTVLPVDNEVRSLIHEGGIFKKKENPFLYHEIYKNNELTGYFFNTKDAAPGAKGYGGPIEIIVWIDKNGSVKNLKILNHNESPDYAADIVKDKFLNQFKGKVLNDDFIAGKDIDAVTGATISSRSVAFILKSGLDNMRKVIPGGAVGKSKGGRLNLDIDFYITVSIITFLLFTFYFKSGLLKYAGLIGSVAYFGFIKARYISLTHLGTLLLGNFPDWKSNLSWYLFIVSGLVLSFLFRGFYCRAVCPFGGLQVLLNKIFRFNISITPLLAKKLRKIKYILLWILVLLILLLNNANAADYEPFSTVFLRRGNLAARAAALIILILSMFHYRPFCAYFCAPGAFMEILSKTGKKVFIKK